MISSPERKDMGSGSTALLHKGAGRMETWIDAKGTEGRYQISSKGRIRCMPRYIKGKNGNIRRLPMQVLGLTVQEVRLVREKLAEGVHPYRVAEEMGISRKAVSKIKSGRSYAWLH